MESNPQAPVVSGKARWTGYIMSAIPVLMLLMSAVMKFLKPAAVVEGFTKMGIPERLSFGLGAVELTCTLLYVIPRTSVLGAIFVTGYLGGAILTLLRVGESFVPPLILGVLIWGGLFLRDPRLRALIPLRR